MRSFQNQALHEHGATPGAADHQRDSALKNRANPVESEAQRAPRSGQEMTLATNTVTRDDVPSEVVTALEGRLDRYW